MCAEHASEKKKKSATPSVWARLIIYKSRESLHALEKSRQCTHSRAFSIGSSSGDESRYIRLYTYRRSAYRQLSLIAGGKKRKKGRTMERGLGYLSLINEPTMSPPGEAVALFLWISHTRPTYTSINRYIYTLYMASMHIVGCEYNIRVRWSRWNAKLHIIQFCVWANAEDWYRGSW